MLEKEVKSVFVGPDGLKTTSPIIVPASKIRVSVQGPTLLLGYPKGVPRAARRDGFLNEIAVRLEIGLLDYAGLTVTADRRNNSRTLFFYIHQNARWHCGGISTLTHLNPLDWFLRFSPETLEKKLKEQGAEDLWNQLVANPGHLPPSIYVSWDEKKWTISEWRNGETVHHFTLTTSEEGTLPDRYVGLEHADCQAWLDWLEQETAYAPATTAQWVRNVGQNLPSLFL